GIRAKLVTGVQTCALPIWDLVPEHDLSLTDAEDRCCTLAGPLAQRSGSVPKNEDRFDVPSARPQLDDPARARQGAIEGDRLRVRSEERRVGKAGGAGEAT